MLSGRLDAEREDLLDSEHYGDVVFTLKKGMIVNYKLIKNRQVKR
jgi:hypothetical protein